MRVNREIRAAKVRVISSTGEQVGILAFHEALKKAEEEGFDLVEVAPNVYPPVCKIMDFGKFRYDQAKKEKESKKAQHQIKVKEVKIKPNIDTNDFNTKLRHAREFIAKGNKVKLTCTFRGREMAHPEIGEELVRTFCEDLSDVADVEAPPKKMGRILHAVLTPGGKKKKIGAPGTTSEETS